MADSKQITAEDLATKLTLAIGDIVGLLAPNTDKSVRITRPYVEMVEAFDEQGPATWAAIASAPKDRTTIIALVPLRDGGFVQDRVYFEPEAYGGSWWWIESPAYDYHADSIDECNFGNPLFWLMGSEGEQMKVLADQDRVLAEMRKTDMSPEAREPVTVDPALAKALGLGIDEAARAESAYRVAATRRIAQLGEALRPFVHLSDVFIAAYQGEGSAVGGSPDARDHVDAGLQAVIEALDYKDLHNARAALDNFDGSPALPQDVIDLVIAGRAFLYEPGWCDGISPESDAFDKALDAFASRVPYDDEPEEGEANG